MEHFKMHGHCHLDFVGSKIMKVKLFPDVILIICANICNNIQVLALNQI